jgi:hypothetical protein
MNVSVEVSVYFKLYTLYNVASKENWTEVPRRGFAWGGGGGGACWGCCLSLLHNLGTEGVCLTSSRSTVQLCLAPVQEDQCEVGQRLLSIPADGCSAFQTMFPYLYRCPDK